MTSSLPCTELKDCLVVFLPFFFKMYLPRLTKCWRRGVRVCDGSVEVRRNPGLNVWFLGPWPTSSVPLGSPPWLFLFSFEMQLCCFCKVHRYSILSTMIWPVSYGLRGNKWSDSRTVVKTFEWNKNKLKNFGGLWLVGPTPVWPYYVATGIEWAWRKKKKQEGFSENGQSLFWGGSILEKKIVHMHPWVWVAENHVFTCVQSSSTERASLETTWKFQNFLGSKAVRLSTHSKIWSDAGLVN